MFWRYESSPLAFSWANSAKPFDLTRVLEAYYDRNETLSLEMVGAPVWDYSPSTDFTVNVNIKIPYANVQNPCKFD